MIAAGVIVLSCEAFGMLFVACLAALLLGWTRHLLRKWQG